MSIVAILLGIFAIGFIALLHELGHFFFAKRAGMKVLELSLGAGPKIFSFTKGETDYTIRLIPVLAFVKIEEEGPGSLKDASFLARFFMYIGGVTFNFLTAIIIFTLIGVFSGMVTDKVIVGKIIPDTPASVVLEKNDQILEFNGNKVQDIEGFIIKLNENGSQEISLKVLRDEKLQEVKITPLYDQENSKYYLGFNFGTEKMNIFSSFIYSFKVSIDYISETFKLIGNMLIGTASAKDNLVGVVGIVSLTSTFATNVADFMVFIAILSLGMAVINILPLPALDGGKIVLLLLEKIRGKKVNEKVEVYLTIASFALLILLMLYTTYNDIARIFGG